MILRTNVKLNLGLRVLGRRPDGYHDLETLFVPCDAFGDVLEVLPADDFSLELTGPEYRGWSPEDDLVAKAWRLLRDEFGIQAVNARLEKRSPVGAGLGGGSADGAFMLKALNELFGLGLSEDSLAARAAHLGSDCAFFAYNRPMFATGRGEILEPFDIDLSGFRFEVVVPEGVSVNTREAYKGVDSYGFSAETPLKECLQKPIEYWKEEVVNDFERSVFPLYPAIAELKQLMYAKGAVYAAMTGSGSAVFGIFAK